MYLYQMSRIFGKNFVVAFVDVTQSTSESVPFSDLLFVLSSQLFVECQMWCWGIEVWF